jgi:ATP-dependent Clp endopeptidase proteolytic subunit ClpP
MLALSQGHNDWYRIRNAVADGGPAQLHIYDEIGFMGVTASDLISELADINGPLDVHLNSPGGEVNDGLAIYNCLLARDEVNVHVDGIAASIASVIAMAGDKIKIAPTAQIMVHNPFTGVIGDASDLRAMADRLDENKSNISRIYAMRTGKTESHWMKVMDDEGWYRGQEAVDAGLADELIAFRTKGSPKAQFDMSIYNSTAKNAAHHPYHSHTEPMHEPMTGVHSHNHSAFGCDDHDDGMHAHSHMHSGDATHGHEHMLHDHGHGHEHPHQHAHEMGQGDTYGPHDHQHAHHAGLDHDAATGQGESETSYNSDHDHNAPVRPGVIVNGKPYDIFNKDKYNQADRDAMAKSGEAMADGSYPIKDEEDLHNAILAVGRGTKNSHSAIRQHIIKRAHAMGKGSMLPDSWGEGGSSATSEDVASTIVYNDADAAALLSALR